MKRTLFLFIIFLIIPQTERPFDQDTPIYLGAAAVGFVNGLLLNKTFKAKGFQKLKPLTGVALISAATGFAITFDMSTSLVGLTSAGTAVATFSLLALFGNEDKAKKRN